MKLLSINIGVPENLTVGKKKITTGIFKKPVASAYISELGLENDTIGDPDHHGGADQAVYIYSVEDYGWWSGELDRPLMFGMFGENLTVDSFGKRPITLGDQFQIDDVLLEVTAPRIPCATLAARMNDAQFVKKFANANRTGIYTRVLKTGEISADSPIQYIPTSENHPTITEFTTFFYAKERSPEEIQKFLDAPIAERARAIILEHFVN